MLAEAYREQERIALSLDSRTAEIGPIPLEQVAGKVLFVCSRRG